MNKCIVILIWWLFLNLKPTLICTSFHRQEKSSKYAPLVNKYYESRGTYRFLNIRRAL